MESYATLSEAMHALEREGYVNDFNLKWSLSDYHFGDFVIDKVYRFDIETDPDDQSVLYAISSVDHKIKGTLVNGFGIYSDPLANKIIEHLIQRD